ncbi:hypothetical protein FRACYDRAFT_197568 [Fragilariopsis cylindrus CCMP1102]|uniref:Methyltransferase domain-containing protein n=1 Tax=Fragilariopsis cylindrus CCMP1102 TaxID=635003 RepID=A0A1E7ENW4_9STRA|nr:hypothetical protein FRACYDRAFT_197568 [Fragilariopsis cylindrus CCMP1102]|eukprot:OEU07544.1 hypothetical protein FRACYDRAFT_197568 [Fragilariopsis cylindrus CCMP1102]
MSTSISPFEWLTSPESLGGLIQDHVLSLKSSSSSSSSSCTALHIGCGSSTVGEYLVQQLNFSKVVNADRDREILEYMQQRCNDKRMEFYCYDYYKEKLPNQYTEYFDLVIDKGTLDCTLCSDSTAVASFLIEVYRSLKKLAIESKSSDDDNDNNGVGGVYLVISYHELDLMLPMLRDMPGAEWTVDYTTMERQIETLPSKHNNNNNNGSNNNGSNTNTNDNGKEKEDRNDNIIQSQQSSTTRKPLNVLIARRCCHNSNIEKELDFNAICQHVETVNNRWFQEEQPLLTDKRIQELKYSFSILSLEEGYDVIFTAAERESLTYEHFLEDWSAFTIQNETDTDTDTNTSSNSDITDKTNSNTSSSSSNNSSGMHMTYEMALNFLRENQ